MHQKNWMPFCFGIVGTPFVPAACHREAHRATATMSVYCLEMLRYIGDEDESRARDGIFEHVGYEHRVDPSTGHCKILIFRTKKKAAQYYDENNPDMRPLNNFNTWRSDWHPVTRLAYVAREYHGVVAHPK